MIKGVESQNFRSKLQILWTVYFQKAKSYNNSATTAYGATKFGDGRTNSGRETCVTLEVPVTSDSCGCGHSAAAGVVGGNLLPLIMAGVQH